jgi:phosphoribosylamine-glycine ligase
LKAAIQTAYAGVGKIGFEGMQYRRDIGGKGLRRGV